MNRMERTWLVDIRQNLGLTQQEVADKAGIGRSFYTQIENGRRDPSVDTAKKLSDVMNFNWTNFFERKCCVSTQITA